MFTHKALRSNILERIKKTDASKLQDEYARLVEGLQDSSDELPDEDSFMTSPGMPSHQ
jgi:DNA excision repair protein ERCC-2